MNENFLGWVCPLLRQNYLPIDTVVFYETDVIEDIYFLTLGNAGFVLPMQDNIVYIEVQVGDLFGQLDITLIAIQRQMDVQEMFDQLQFN